MGQGLVVDGRTLICFPQAILLDFVCDTLRARATVWLQDKARRKLIDHRESGMVPVIYK